MLKFQDSLDRGNQRKNAENILKVQEIPCNDQIMRLIDGIEPGVFDGNFCGGLRLTEEYSGLEQYHVLDGGVLIAPDGVWYHSSERTHCEHCLHLTKNWKTAYYHNHRMTAAVMARPGGEAVLPLAPEMIRNEDAGEELSNGNYEKQNRTVSGRRRSDYLKNTENTIKHCGPRCRETIYMPIMAPVRRFPARVWASAFLDSRTS
jgi:hypothetical protein